MIRAIITLVFICGISFAQPVSNPIRYVTTDPTGTACSAQSVSLLTPNGNLYTCQNGTYAIVGAGSGGGGGGGGGGGTTPGYQPSQPLAGCGVEYVSGLTYSVGACSYIINGIAYTSALTSETLAAADPTNPRIDVIGVDITGSVFVITGTPAATPAAPTVDPTQQLALTIAVIPANSSTPANTTVVANVYDENTEWTCTASAHLNCASTTNPYRGTKDVEATNAVLNNNVTFVKPAAGTVDLATTTALIFYIRSKGTFPTGASGNTAARSIAVYWQNGSTQKGQQVILRDGQFGFSSSNTTAYQQISIPSSLFGANGIPVTTLVMNVSGPNGSSSIGFYIDAISLQGNTSTITILPAVTMASGTSGSLFGNNEYFYCTNTCTITVPIPSPGVQYCVFNDDNVSTVITLSAIGANARYEGTGRTSYGTAGTGTAVSGGAAGDKICIVGRDSTHYFTLTSQGTWTMN